MVNHIPGMINIYRKNLLGRNLNKLRKLLPDMFDFFPKTWTLPTERIGLMKEMKKFENRKGSASMTYLMI